MKSLFTKFFLIPIVLLLLCFTAFAQLPDLIQESFDYPAGQDLEGMGEATGGWAGAWAYTTGTAGMIGIYDGTVAVVPLPCDTAGNYIEVTPESDLAIWRQLAEPMLDVGQTFWISLLYQRLEGDYDADPEASYNGLSLFNGATELVYIGKPYAAKTLGVDAHSGSGSVPLSEYDAKEGAWIVIKFVMDGTTVNDSGYIFINPDPNEEPTEAEADTSFFWIGSNGWDRFRIGCNNACWVAYDEIKIATNYAGLNQPVSGLFSSPVGNFPFKFALEQNYPNPFNPMTTISYNIPVASDVNITVFNVLGQEVTTLVNEQKMPGTYQAYFNATNFTSGIYFYQMQAGSFTKTKKMMLVR
jgi:hypothetical protein